MTASASTAAIAFSARLGENLSIVLVSGTRTEPHDRVAGLLLGADDYLVKLFAADELLARVEKLVLRSLRTRSGNASSLTHERGRSFASWHKGSNRRRSRGDYLYKCVGGMTSSV
jgi:DNA-binding response OmpR family regulator